MPLSRHFSECLGYLKTFCSDSQVSFQVITSELISMQTLQPRLLGAYDLLPRGLFPCLDTFPSV